MTPICGIHPYADMYPMLPESQIASLAESIRDNGLREPITVTPDGLILDGRNRYKACQRAGVKPVTVVYEGDDLADYVMDRNDHRRHIPTGQSAMAAALVLQADGRRRNGRWIRGSVDSSNGSVTTSWKQRLNECGVILDHASHLAKKVRDGDMALDAAFRIAKAQRDLGSTTKAPKVPAIPAENIPLAFDTDWEFRFAELQRERLWENDSPRTRAAKRNEIAAAIDVISRYGCGDNASSLIVEFDPVQIASDRRFNLEALQAAHQFITELIDWRNNQ